MEIRFRQTRRKHSSGFGIIEKSGDLQFDRDKNSADGIWIYHKDGTIIAIDFDYTTREFRLFTDFTDNDKFKTFE